MLTLKPGEELSTQMDTFVIDANGVMVNPFAISYAIYFRDSSGLVLVTPTNVEEPLSDATGHFYPYWKVPEDASSGFYRIHWSIQIEDGGPTDTLIQEFQVAEELESKFPPEIQTLIDKLRVILRDNNPDRNYHFMPPAWRNQKDSVTQHFGYIWEDEELAIFLEMGLAAYNWATPQSDYRFSTLKNGAEYPVLLIAASMACAAVALNWVADEFDYSIGGKSLTIEKSSKYQSMKDSFDQQAQTAIEQKRLRRHVAGLAQRTRAITMTGGKWPSSRLSAQAVRLAISYITPWL